MNRSKTARLAALFASIAMTGVIVQAIADYGYPMPAQSTLMLAKAAAPIAR